MQEGVQLSLWLLPHTECGLFNTMAYAVDCGSWYKAAATKEEAILLAEEVIGQFKDQCHPWGDLWVHQLVHELEPNEGINSYGEIDTFPF